MNETWTLVHAERRALIEDLSTLSDEEWRTPSGCAGWSVHDVAAHLVDNAKAIPLGVVLAMARARFDFDRQNDQGVAREQGATPAETLRRLQDVAERTSGPPAPVASRLVEEIAHGEDIRRPLGLHRTYPAAALRDALTYQARTPDGMGGAKGLLRRVRLVADDLDLTVGDGPDVRGPALELLMVATGRSPRARSLSGDGVAHLPPAT